MPDAVTLPTSMIHAQAARPLSTVLSLTVTLMGTQVTRHQVVKVHFHFEVYFPGRKYTTHHTDAPDVCHTGAPDVCHTGCVPQSCISPGCMQHLSLAASFLSMDCRTLPPLPPGLVHAWHHLV